jgi:DNA-directed RNA polymerase I, II, and III subunit RPABC2
MSYFDNEKYGGADGSDNDNDDEKNSQDSDDSGSETETETNIDEEIEDDEEDDDQAKGLEDDDDDEDEEDKPKQSLHLEKDAEDENADADADAGDEEVSKKKTKKLPTGKQKSASKAPVYDEEDDEDPTGEVYLQKFDKEINDNYLVNFHPESAVHNYDEILTMTKIIRDKAGIIIDDLHKTLPFITKYERARILGQRAKQINSGASVFVKVPEKVIDGYLIAELELQEKRIPFIIRRPMPNGGSEYWSIKDLENIAF